MSHTWESFYPSSPEDVYLTGRACYDRAKYRYAFIQDEFLEYVAAGGETGSSRSERVIDDMSRLSPLQERRFSARQPAGLARDD